MESLLQVKNNEILTTSVLIAEKFCKQHDNVLKRIRALEAEIEVSSNLTTPHLFEKTEHVNDQNGQTYPMYLVNRDGFTLLAMGFTGKAALEWKLKYIAAFNAMEKMIRDQQADNRLEIARLILNAPPAKVASIKALYPEYFPVESLPGAFENLTDQNMSYTKWIEDCGVDRDWIGEFPTTEIYFNYVRYCHECRMTAMGKKRFYATLARDYGLIRKQKANGQRYFLTA